MSLTIDQLAFLRTAEAAELLEMSLTPDPLGALGDLRKRTSADNAAAVAELRKLRDRAEASGRFPREWARILLATDKLLQQASSARLAGDVGRELARRAGGRSVIDLCCGLGADAVGLALAGMDVIGVDIAPEAIMCATHNAERLGVSGRCEFVQADATCFEIPEGATVHVDPDRRASGRRAVALADHEPDEGFLRELVGRTAAGALKLSPAFSADALVGWPEVAVETISEGGVCRQCLLWWPTERRSSRATVVGGEAADPQTTSIEAGVADPARLDEPGEWLIEPDAAVIAAGGVDDLAAAHGLWRIDASLAWLFGPQRLETPLATSFRVLREVPGRPRDVRKAIADLDGGVVEIKPSGLRLETAELQRDLRGRGQRRLTVLWTQFGRRQTAFIAERS